MQKHTTVNAVNYELTAQIIANGSKNQANTQAEKKRNWEAISAVSILSLLIGAVLLACHFGLINTGI